MTAAQPIDLPPLPKCKMLSGPNLDSLHALYTADQMRDYAALARQQPAASGAGEVAASDYLLRTAGQALRSYQYGNSAPDLAAGIADRIDAQLAAASAAPHAQAEPVGYISEGTRAMLAAGCSTPITISISTGKAAVWCAPMYLSVPVPQEAEPVGYVVDNDKGESIINVSLPVGTQVFTQAVPQEAEQAAPAAVTLREEFDRAFLSLNSFHTRAELDNEWSPGSLSGEMFRAGAAALTQPAAPAVTDAARDVLGDAKGPNNA